MMELVKKHIHMNRRSGSVASQMTLDDDFNVPDTMEDVEQLILERGEIQIESAKNQGEKVEVRGRLDFRVLYRTPGGQVMTLAGNLPFEERVNMPGLLENDHIQAGWELDDLKLGIINSRKLNVKALVTLKLQAETLFDAEAAEDARFDGDVETLKKTMAVAALSARRKDTFRVREVLSLSGNKPDIDTLLWQDIRLRGVNTRPLDGRIRLDGELMVFAIYSGEAGQVPVQCLEETVPFSGEVELEPSVEEMIPFITVRLVHKELEVNPDSDGEMRELSMDGVLEVQLLYLTADDSSPVGASTEVLPFHMTAQVPGITEDSVYQMEPGLEQVSAVMLGGDSVEIKASVTMDVLVLNQVCGQVILNVREEPLDTERLKQIPGIVGYVVQPGDSLWKIARKFHTSVDAVMADNGLTDPSIRPGDKLIIVKAVGERV